jgi:hypothetical protein
MKGPMKHPERDGGYYSYHLYYRPARRTASLAYQNVPFTYSDACQGRFVFEGFHVAVHDTIEVIR